MEGSVFKTTGSLDFEKDHPSSIPTVLFGTIQDTLSAFDRQYLLVELYQYPYQPFEKFIL